MCVYMCASVCGPGNREANTHEVCATLPPGHNGLTGFQSSANSLLIQFGTGLDDLKNLTEIYLKM